MSAKVRVSPQNAWDFFKKNKERLSREIVTIAEDDEAFPTFEICMTEEDDYPCLIVYEDDDEIEREPVISKTDCEDVAQSFFDDYIYKVSPGNLEIPEEADYREDELITAMAEFINTAAAVGTDSDEVVDELGLPVVKDILDNCLHYIATEHGLHIYYPKLTIDEHGNEVYEDYPYNDSFEDLP